MMKNLNLIKMIGTIIGFSGVVFAVGVQVLVTEYIKFYRRSTDLI
jgi:hypothetical protein